MKGTTVGKRKMRDEKIGCLQDRPRNMQRDKHMHQDICKGPYRNIHHDNVKKSANVSDGR